MQNFAPVCLQITREDLPPEPRLLLSPVGRAWESQSISELTLGWNTAHILGLGSRLSLDLGSQVLTVNIKGKRWGRTLTF